MFWWGLFVSVQCCTPSFPTTWPPASPPARQPASLARPCSSSVLGALEPFIATVAWVNWHRTWTLGLAKIGIGEFLSSFLLSYLTPHLHALYSQSSPIGRLQQRARQRQVQAFYLPTYLPTCLALNNLIIQVANLVPVGCRIELAVIRCLRQYPTKANQSCANIPQASQTPPLERLAAARDNTAESLLKYSSSSTYTRPTLVL